LPTLCSWSEANFHHLPNISRTYPYGYQNFQKEKPRLFEPEKQETPSVPLFRGKIGRREEGYKFQDSGQLWLMVQGSRLRVNSGAWFRVNGFLAKRGFAF